jgi:hypothetical protein
MRRQPLTDLLSLDALYQMIVRVPGVIMEFGVHWGRHLAALTALRGIYEPYNPHRRIVGFDTFTGFPNAAGNDMVSASARPGRFAVPRGYPAHLREVLFGQSSLEVACSRSTNSPTPSGPAKQPRFEIPLASAPGTCAPSQDGPPPST